MKEKVNIQKLLAIWWVRFLVLLIAYLSVNYFVYEYVSANISTDIGIFERFFFITLFSRFLPILLLSLLINYFRAESNLRTFGFNFDSFALKQFGTGIAFALLATLIYHLAGISFGGEFIVKELEYDSLFFAIVFVIFIQSTFEEIIFRGELFQNLIDRWNPAVITILVSSIFSISHYGNPNFSIHTFFSIFLAGIAFSVLFIQTRSLWICISFHISWNIFSAYLMGSNVSGINMGIKQFELDKTNLSDLGFAILGGDFGVEEGYLSLLVLIFVILYSIKYLKPSPVTTSKLFKRKYVESKLLDKEI